MWGKWSFAHALHISHLIKQVLACNYVPPLEENVSYGKVQYPEDHRPKRETQEWDTIRIEIVYDPTVEKLTPARREILEQLIINARDYFESTLMVHRLSSIELTPKCIGTKTVLPNGIIECGEDCEQRCGEAVVSKAEYFLKCICNGARCRRAQGGGGGKDADFILFVSVRSKNCIANSLAYATHCALDEKTGRPIAGHVNICPDSFNHMMANELSQWESTIKHELIHVFVFSPSLFKKFPGAKQKWINDDGTIPGVIQRITRMDWETASGMIEHDVYMIATPKVRNEARKYFSCSSLEGAELENQGGRGTSLSHWEKRVFENEAMSGVSTQVFAISRLTLALFEDSGWYKANYEKADEMAWGHGLGCAFAKKSCLSWMLSHRVDPYPFCTVYEDASFFYRHCLLVRVLCFVVNLTIDICFLPTTMASSVPVAALAVILVHLVPVRGFRPVLPSEDEGETTTVFIPTQEGGQEKTNEFQYEVFPKKVTWEQAEKECRDNGANLASVLSKAENQFIYELSKEYPNNDRLWIGLLEKANGSEWVDNSPLGYTNYAHKIKKSYHNHCVEMVTRAPLSGKWNQLPCDTTDKGFICKKKAYLIPQ